MMAAGCNKRMVQSNPIYKVFGTYPINLKQPTLKGEIIIKYIPTTNPHCALVVGYGPFSLCAIHKESLCPSSGDGNRLMMMIYHSRFIPEGVAEASQIIF
jgi:hypothetical protein